VAFAFNLRRILLTIDIPIPRIANSRGNRFPSINSHASPVSAAWVPFASSIPWVREHGRRINSPLTTFTFPLSFFRSFRHVTSSSKREIESRQFARFSSPAPLLVYPRSGDTSILALLAASAPSPGILSDANASSIPVLFYHFIIISASHLHVSHLLLRRRNTPPRHLGFQTRIVATPRDRSNSDPRSCHRSVKRRTRESSRREAHDVSPRRCGCVVPPEFSPPVPLCPRAHLDLPPRRRAFRAVT